MSQRRARGAQMVQEEVAPLVDAHSLHENNYLKTLRIGYHRR